MLDEALSLIERHHKAVISAAAQAHTAEGRRGAGRGGGQGAALSPGAARRASATPQKLSEVVSQLERQLQMDWAAELSEVRRGLH